jgi:hypothetical protein
VFSELLSGNGGNSFFLRPAKEYLLPDEHEDRCVLSNPAPRAPSTTLDRNLICLPHVYLYQLSVHNISLLHGTRAPLLS